MSLLPNSPRLLKGALVSLDPSGPRSGVIVFQYNPETVTRSLTPQSVGGGDGGQAAPGEALRLSGPPQESLRFDVVLDATDQLEAGHPIGITLGLGPQLAALELLLYPQSSRVIANEALLAAGIIEVVPPESPLTVLIWGSQRILPVRVTEFSVTEEMHDPRLNPIQARVSLGLRVLNYRDLGLPSPGGALFMAHQIAKETLARLNSANLAATGSTRIAGGIGLGI